MQSFQKDMDTIKIVITNQLYEVNLSNLPNTFLAEKCNLLQFYRENFLFQDQVPELLAAALYPAQINAVVLAAAYNT